MGKTLAQFRDELRLDLKDVASVLWKDEELNHCVRRAVNDLSRFLPLEQVYEDTLDFDVEDESITTLAATSATAIVNAQSLEGKSNGDTLTIADYTPDAPRRLTVTLTDANYSVTALTITIRGYNQHGYYVEENWSLKDLKVSGTAYQGRQYFTRVIEVVVSQISGSPASTDTISVGTGNYYDSFVFLANKPIKPESETVTNAAGTTTYTRDTDYTMDYINGGIKLISGGSMAAATAYLVDYTKSKLGINISSVLPNLTRIQRVEFPVDSIPQTFVSHSMFGDFLHITSKGTNKSQEELTEEHIAIYYERPHFPPGEGSPGSYPELLDELVAIGAGGHALLVEAQQYEQQAVTDLAAMRTELGYTTAIHTAFATAIAKVITYLETNTNDNTKYWLTKITTDVAALRTAIATALDAANSYLDEVDVTDLGKASVGAEAYTEAGDEFINAVNLGAQVAENYRSYSQARTEIANARISAALAYIQEAGLRLQNVTTYYSQSSGWSDVAAGFISEAQQHLQRIDRYIQEAAMYAEIANGDLVLADRFRTEGLNRINEFHAILKNKAEYRKRISTVAVQQSK